LAHRGARALALIQLQIQAKVFEVPTLNAHYDRRIVANPCPVEAKIRLLNRLREIRADARQSASGHCQAGGQQITSREHVILPWLG